MNRSKERCRVAVLEVSAPAPVDHQRITGKDSRTIGTMQKVSVMVVCVARDEQWVEPQLADGDRFALADGEVGMVGLAPLGNRGLAPGQTAKPRGARHVVGVDVGLDRISERQSKLADHLKVPI